MKLFLSVTVLELSSEGILDLEVPIEEYLPELRAAGRASINVGHLLSHTSGYRGIDISSSQVRWNYSWQCFLSHWHNHAPNFSPGRVFNYEHSEHVVLGEIVRRTCGRSSAELVEERIFDPLSIHRSCAKADLKNQIDFVGQHAYSPMSKKFTPMSIPAFSSFWASSLPDATLTLRQILSVGDAILDAWRSDENRKIFSPSTMGLLQQTGPALPTQVVSGIRSEDMPASFGMGFAHYGNGVMGHNGSMFGQTCTLKIDSSQNVAIAVGVNAWAPYARDNAVRRTLALITGNDAISKDPLTAMERIPFQLEELIKGFSLGGIEGRYVGSYFGEVCVSSDANGVHFDVGSAQSKTTRVSAVKTESGSYILESAMPVTLGFFSDPADHNRPSLMMGVHAYKKMS